MSSPADLPLDGTSTVRPPTFELSRRTFLGTAAGSGLAAYAVTRTAAAHHDVTSKEGVTMPSTQTDATPTNDAAMQRADELLRQMTIEEKAMQVSCVVPLALLGPDGLMRGQLDALLGLGIGRIAGLGMIGNKMPRRSPRPSTPSSVISSPRPDWGSPRLSTTRRSTVRWRLASPPSPDPQRDRQRRHLLLLVSPIHRSSSGRAVTDRT